jgi:hypothetical protein
VHIETSGDADSWIQRRKRFEKEFRVAERHYRDVFAWDYREVKKVAIVSFRKPPENMTFGPSILILPIPELMDQIRSELRGIDPTRVVVPESYPLLRAIQFAVGLGVSR